MAITMQDIQDEGFEHALRGYDVGQVDVFLERVANEVDAMNKRIEELESELKEAKDEISKTREELAQASSLAENRREVGHTLPVLVDASSRRDAGVLAGKSPKLQTVHAPLADGMHIEDVIGQIVDVRIDDATTNYLQGTVV